MNPTIPSFMLKNITQHFLNMLMKPYWIVAFTALLSAAAWFTPDSFGLYKGYNKPASISQISMMIIYSWYSCIFILTYIGFNIGKKLKIITEFNSYANLDNDFIYKAYSWIALLGFSYTVIVTIKVIGITGFIFSVVTFTTNNIAEAIYKDYHQGIFSLRYILVISFGIALYRTVILKKYRALDFLNFVVFVFYIAFFGRRLQLLCSLMVFFTLANRDLNFLSKVKIKKILILTIFGFAMLSTATLLRGYGSYAKMGYTNPFAAIATNVVSYLAAPFQVSLGVANNIEEAFGNKRYWQFADIEENLTANSAFVGMPIENGLFSLVIIIFYSVVFSVLAGWFYKNRHNYLYMSYPVILYAFAELWRIDLFNKGIFITLLIVSATVPILCTLLFCLLPRKNPTPLNLVVHTNDTPL